MTTTSVDRVQFVEQGKKPSTFAESVRITSVILEKLAVTRNHNIVSGSEIPASASASPHLGIPCGCKRNHPIKFYCEIHKDVV